MIEDILRYHIIGFDALKLLATRIYIDFRMSFFCVSVFHRTVGKSLYDNFTIIINHTCTRKLRSIVEHNLQSAPNADPSYPGTSSKSGFARWSLGFFWPWRPLPPFGGLSPAFSTASADDGSHPSTLL